MMWPFRINWAATVDVDYEFRTEVFTSLSGREQRRALRQTPRMSMEFSCLETGDSARSLAATLATRAADEFEIPDFSERVRILAPAPIGQNFLVVSRVAWWIEPGARMIVGGEIVTVESVSGTSVTIAGALTRGHDFNTPAYLARRAVISNDAQIDHRTSQTSSLRLRFDVLPGHARFAPTETPRGAYDGREVWMHRPNWRNAVRQSFAHGRTSVDYGFGRVSYFNEQPFISRVFQVLYTGVDADPAYGDPRDPNWGSDLFRASQDVSGDPITTYYPASVSSLIDSFRRARGMAREFWAPTWTGDLVLEAVAAGQTQITVPGRETHDQFDEDRANRAVAIMLRNRKRQFRRVSGSAVVGGDTVLTLDAPLTDGGPVALACWMPLSRLASDTLSVRWRSSRVADVTLAMRSLETI